MASAAATRAAEKYLWGIRSSTYDASQPPNLADIIDREYAGLVETLRWIDERVGHLGWLRASGALLETTTAMIPVLAELHLRCQAALAEMGADTAPSSTPEQSEH